MWAYLMDLEVLLVGESLMGFKGFAALSVVSFFLFICNLPSIS